MRKRTKAKKSFFQKMILLVLGLLIVISLVIAFVLYRYLFAPNVVTGDKHTFSLYVATGDTYQDVLDSLYRHGIIRNHKSFQWLAQKKKYPDLVKPGRYVLQNGMSNLVLINMLRSGDQTPVNVTFNSVRTVRQLARVISLQLEADSNELNHLLTDETFLEKYGLNRYTALTIFIPNTYEFYWNSTAPQFIERMDTESVHFWNSERKAAALTAGLTPVQVITLASIIEKETNRNSEKARIAGVYMNRLKKGWLLQADPTVVYATGEFHMTRVLNQYKKIDSPYNTYKYRGLPPGPICIPSIASIDAVLDYEKHDYMYFVARSDLSGYHVFSKTLREHNIHAKQYRNAIKSSGNNS